MFQIFLVASGGATGAISRYLINYLFKLYFNNNLFATLCVNVIGSFFIGYLISYGYSKSLSENFIKYFLIIGFLGSFTTFSAFSSEVVNLYLSNKLFLSFSYVIISVTICVFAAYIGISINKF